MLSPRLIPTRLIDPALRPKLVIAEVTPPSRLRTIAVVTSMAGFLWALLLLRLRGALTSGAAGGLLRDRFERLGGLWLKAGQLLSLRIDLFPQAFCQELAKLQNRSVGFPTPLARAIIEEDLGAPIAQYFDEFGERPFAVASIGQVYRARLRQEGVYVAVKVQKPFAAEMFARDLVFIRWVVRLLQIVRFRRHMRWDLGYDELCEVMKEELDFHYEASSMRRMRKSLRGAQDLRPPRLQPLLVAAHPRQRVHPRRADGGLHPRRRHRARAALGVADRERRRSAEGRQAPDPLDLPPAAREQPLSRRSPPRKHRAAARQPDRAHRLRIDELHRARVPAALPDVHPRPRHPRLCQGRGSLPDADRQPAEHRHRGGQGKDHPRAARLGDADAGARAPLSRQVARQRDHPGRHDPGRVPLHHGVGVAADSPRADDARHLAHLPLSRRRLHPDAAALLRRRRAPPPQGDARPRTGAPLAARLRDGARHPGADQPGTRCSRARWSGAMRRSFAARRASCQPS